ncbi:MAG: L-threonylcarbamoyladenylate synthase [Candidatus Omnitrophota bacterium]|nr:L-threonylcarbamoyladenylate synthase [Candidatus Omnitrophota bacterium]
MKTYVVKINPKSPEKDLIESAAKAVREGKLVAFPTETVYGIAANFLDEKAIESLYSIKGRPKNKPFTVHIADIKMIESLGCTVTKEALILISKFWPGPLTIILKSDGGNTLGFRAPANLVALELIKAAGVPIVAPSANLSGNKPPKSAGEVLKDLDGKIDMLLDSGATDVGIESTVVDLTVSPPKILREGAVKKEELVKFFN